MVGFGVPTNDTSLGSNASPLIVIKALESELICDCNDEGIGIELLLILDFPAKKSSGEIDDSDAVADRYQS